MDDGADLPRAPHDETLRSGRQIRNIEGNFDPLSPEDRENQEALDLFRSPPPFSLHELFPSRFPPLAYSLCFCGFLFGDLISMASSLPGSFCVWLFSYFDLVAWLWWSCPAVSVLVVAYASDSSDLFLSSMTLDDNRR